MSGNGFNTPITAKEADLNAVFTAGVKTCFYLAAAPIGWTVSNPGTNYTLVSAAVGGTVGGGGGRGDNLVAGCTVVPDHVHTQQGTFTSGSSNQSLSHTHPIPSPGTTGFTPGGLGGLGSGAALTNTLAADLSAHTHQVTISGTTSFVASGGAAAGNWSPLYALIIIAIKN